MSKKLLLADDSITIQKVIQITFAHEDYDLTITDNGDTALAKAQELKPDLVMADVYMPGKNGYELTAAIRQDPDLQHTPVLLLAGSFEPFDEEKARNCRANAWIEKPFESQNLIDKVSELLNSSPPSASEAQTFAVPELAPQGSTLEDFDQLPTTEPEAAEVSEEAFGDISFAEETPAFAPEPTAAVDDWSDVVAEPEVVTPEVEETYTLDDETAKDVAEDFSFAEPESVAVEEPVSLAEGTDLDAFDTAEGEIIPLDEGDIIDAEDLEPLPQEPTLTTWSRDSAPDEETFAAEETVDVEESAEAAAEQEVQDAPVFDEPVFDEPVFDEPVFDEPVFDEPVFDEPAAEIAPAFAEPALGPAPVAEVPPAEEEPEHVAVETAIVDVEEKASAMSEDEIEQIIEKVVTKVVEKLAGTILERVAWEVVPDLAEHLIREEIRKIKEAAA
jgi:CheY-like chemotaxis protein